MSGIEEENNVDVVFFFNVILRQKGEVFIIFFLTFA
jgi:hypothetical protein